MVRDVKVVVEYKHLKLAAPGGVYVVPHSLRTWHGIIFVRRGAYASGIFKFQLHLPPEYNGIDTWPELKFETQSVYSPLVDFDSGRVDLKWAYPRWDPTKHFVVTALTFLKKIFYFKAFDEYSDPFNPIAFQAFINDPAAFLKSVDQCVAASRLRNSNSGDCNDGGSTADVSSEEKAAALNGCAPPLKKLGGAPPAACRRLRDALRSAARRDEQQRAVSGDAGQRVFSPADVVLDFLTNTESGGDEEDPCEDHASSRSAAEERPTSPDACGLPVPLYAWSE